MPEEGVCGNGVVEADDGEECDDGNQRSNDGCADDCTLESDVCGDGIETGDEECDDGAANSNTVMRD